MSDWKCPVSAKAQRTVNPIRAIVDKVVGGPQVERSDGKERSELTGRRPFQRIIIFSFLLYL